MYGKSLLYAYYCENSTYCRYWLVYENINKLKHILHVYYRIKLIRLDTHFDENKIVQFTTYF